MMAKYVEGVVPILIEAGARPGKRLRVTNTVETEGDMGFVFMADFPSTEAIRNVVESDAYRTLMPLREEGFTRVEVFIAEDN